MVSKKSRWLRAKLPALVVAVLAGSLGLASGQAHAGYAAMVVDSSTGQVVMQVNPDEQNYPASLTKMMTLYLAFQAVQSGKLKMDQTLPVTAWAANKSPTKLGLRAGQSLTVRDCILGMITKSANDAATVVAEGLGGTELGFTTLMNAQAQRLGMANTHFANASGLPDPHNISSARDLMALSRALYHDFPDQAHLFATKEFMFRGQLVRGHNHLMDRYPGMDGLKTGFTDASGFNLASTAVQDGHRLFGVVMGGRSAAIRDQLMARMLNDGFDHKATPDNIVAAASIASPALRVGRQMLAALSPIPSANAETIPQRRKLKGRHLKAQPVQLAQVKGRKAAPVLAGKRAKLTRLARVTPPKTAKHHHSQRVMLASRKGN